MRGDILVLEKHHLDAGEIIAAKIIKQVLASQTRFIITISGESGSGKSETAKAIADQLLARGITAVILGQDDYFVLPPKSNDQKRREDASWLGPHVEVRMDLLGRHIQQALDGADVIEKPLVDYPSNSILSEQVDISAAKVIIVEGTYTALLRKVDCRIFIDRTRQDTLEHRKKRNRGTEASDPFVESVLGIEHKIIAGHRFLADILISKDYQVSFQ